jgi:hypothetical protein
MQEVVGYIFKELSTIAHDALERVSLLKHYPALGDLVSETAIKCLQVSSVVSEKLTTLPRILKWGRVGRKMDGGGCRLHYSKGGLKSAP